jgi:nucleoside-diphosphate-sugar epimerase
MILHSTCQALRRSLVFEIKLYSFSLRPLDFCPHISAMAPSVILKDPAIEPGSTVLVTGVNGLIGSHVADQVLAAGYKCRGTVRDTNKCAWMADFFDKRHGEGKFGLVSVTDFSKEGCFREAIKGCAGVIHTASHINLFGTDAEQEIPGAIRTVMTCLQDAAKESSVKRFVLTSSGWSSHAPEPNIKFRMSDKTWNDDAVKRAWMKEPKPDSLTIFMAGKTEAEREALKWVQKNKPHFVYNAVLPDTVFGEILNPPEQGIPSTAGMLQMLFNGENLGVVQFLQPQWYIDVADTARLHVAALLDPKANEGRFLGYAGPFNWNDVLARFRKMFPERKFVDDMDLGRDISDVDNSQAIHLLKRVYGQEEWVSLDDTVRANVESFVNL